MTDFTNKPDGICLNEKLSLLSNSFDDFPGFHERSETPCAAFVSVCDKHTRARVLRGTGFSPEEAWSNACRAAQAFVSKSGIFPAWIKADISCISEKVSFGTLSDMIAKSRNEFFRRGISFDDQMKTALIEAEINGSRVITYKKHMLELTKVNKHLAAQGLPVLTAFPEQVVLFDCESRFCDENNAVYKLYSSGNNCGRRILGQFNDKTALEVIKTSSDYLSMQVAMNGKFDYGWYPVYHKEIPGYNILRHASSIWSLICAYRLNKDSFILDQIKKSVGFMVANTFKKYPDKDGEDNTVYLADLQQNEVKLGGNAVAIVMLTEYMDAAGTDRYVKLCRELGNGILELFDQRSGSFFHVLNYPSLSPKDKFRTVYYDGEATFALCRLYGLTGDKKWLNAASRSVDRFIRKNYEQYRDHWVAYAVNELTKYLPENKYLSFGLKNADVNLNRIYNHDTTYHTYLELLCVTLEMYSRIKEQGLACDYLEKFQTEKFFETIYHRADYMLNGYGYPEYVMYFRYPERSLGAFFIRHDGYRIRIDDVQYFCGAYYAFYRNYDMLRTRL